MPLGSTSKSNGSKPNTPVKDGKPPHPQTKPRRKQTDSQNSDSPVSTPETRVHRNKKLINQNISGESCVVHPIVSSLKDSVPTGRRNSLPGKLDDRTKGLKKRTVKNVAVRQAQPGYVNIPPVKSTSQLITSLLYWEWCPITRRTAVCSIWILAVVMFHCPLLVISSAIAQLAGDIVHVCTHTCVCITTF